MTRTEYTTQLRKAGFSVRPAWQAASGETGAAPRDITCYLIYSADGRYLTQLLVRDCEGDLDVFFASPNLRTVDDIVFLKRLDREAAA
ncbi:MAG: hypothetical protein KDJ82_16240 [Rhodobacteraceae bacterium]|nr:hypothetical protein [Paracoccaceae bacterium]